MFRRALLSSLGTAAAAATTGCLSSNDAAQASNPPAAPATATATQTTEAVDPSEHTIEVTRRVDFGPTGLRRVLRASEGGDLTVDLTCPDGSTESASASIGADEWRAFERRVLSADLTAFDDEYRCEGACPSDAPPSRVAFEVDGCVTEVLVDSNAEVPADLAALLDSLDALAERVAYPSCD